MDDDNPYLFLPNPAVSCSCVEAAARPAIESHAGKTSSRGCTLVIAMIAKVLNQQEKAGKESLGKRRKDEDVGRRDSKRLKTGVRMYIQVEAMTPSYSYSYSYSATRLAGGFTFLTPVRKQAGLVECE